MEQLTQAYKQDEKWSDTVKKQIDTKLGDVENDLNSIQKLVVDTKISSRGRKRKGEQISEVRNNQDRHNVGKIMKELIAENFEENEIVNVFRMGRRNETNAVNGTI